MVNLRYHIVSLVAVFLALGVGVLMGSAVIDSFTVDLLRAQQRALEQALRDMEQDREALREELAGRDELDERFAGEADRLVVGTLAGTGVVVLAVEGVGTDVVGRLRQSLGAAGALHAGDVWLTGRFALGEDADRAALAEALGLSPNLSGGVLRSIALARLAEALRGAAAPPGDPAGAEPGAPGQRGVVEALARGGFLRVELPGEVAAGDVPLPVVEPGTRFVLVSGEGARVPDAELARPLVAGLAVAGPAGLVVTGPGQPAEGEGERARREQVIVAMVRASDSLAARVSTVEAVDTALGRLATVLALQDLGHALVGHYGPGADRLLPPQRG